MRGKKVEKTNNSLSEIVNESKMVKRNLVRLRKLKENESSVPQPKLTTHVDQKTQEDKMNQYFAQNNVTIHYEPLEIYDRGVFWSGNIDGQIIWTMTVTPFEETSKLETEYSKDFDAQNPDNDKILKKLEAFYNEFYEYWRDNIFQN